MCNSVDGRLTTGLVIETEIKRGRYDEEIGSPIKSRLWGTIRQESICMVMANVAFVYKYWDSMKGVTQGFASSKYVVTVFLFWDATYLRQTEKLTISTRRDFFGNFYHT